MAHSNSKITAPVSFADVNAVLGTSHTDLATLCKDGNINPWSKVKPVEPSISQIKLGPLGLPASLGYSGGKTDAESYYTINQDWGLTIVNTNGATYDKSVKNPTEIQDYAQQNYPSEGWSINDMAYAIKFLALKMLWGYKRPSTAYRLTDFAGYNHNAKAALYTSFAGSQIEYFTQQSFVVPTIHFFKRDQGDSITLDDLVNFSIGGAKLGDFYLVACAADDEDSDGNGDPVWCTEKPIKNYSGEDSISIVLGYDGSTGLKAGEGVNGYTTRIYFALSTERWDTYEHDSGTPSLFPFPKAAGFPTVLDITCYQQALFNELTLEGISYASGIGSTSLDNIDLRTLTYQLPSYYDAYGDNPHNFITPSGNGVVLKITGTLRKAVSGVSASQMQMSLNTGTAINAAVQIVGANSNCSDHPSTSTTTFNMTTTSYTFYVVAIDNVADAVNEVQLSMRFIGHVQEGLKAASPWMNIHTS